MTHHSDDERPGSTGRHGAGVFDGIGSGRAGGTVRSGRHREPGRFRLPLQRSRGRQDDTGAAEALATSSVSVDTLRPCRTATTEACRLATMVGTRDPGGDMTKNRDDDVERSTELSPQTRCYICNPEPPHWP